MINLEEKEKEENKKEKKKRIVKQQNKNKSDLFTRGFQFLMNLYKKNVYFFFSFLQIEYMNSEKEDKCLCWPVRFFYIYLYLFSVYFQCSVYACVHICVFFSIV